MRQTLRSHREVETVGTEVAEHDGHTDSDHGDTSGNHTRTDTLDDHSSSTRLSCLGNLLGGLIRVRGVVFCSLSDDHASSQTRDDREGETKPVLDTQEVENGEGGDGDEDCTDVRTQ